MANHPTEIVVEPGKQEIVVTRVFDAPRALVFKAFTDPASIPQWWGPRYLTTTIETMQAKPGGLWRFVQRDAGGNVYAFHGVYHSVNAPEQIVSTFEFEGTPGHVLMETVTLQELDGKTKITDQSVFQSVADRDGMVQEGMSQGVNDSMERLDELLLKQLA